MDKCDVAVIGGGLLGCFAARNLTRYGLSAALVESREDVCTGVSKANTAIIYPGYDNKPGSLKAKLTVKANAGFDMLCRELDVPFSRCGSLMLSYGGKADAVLRRKLENGLASGISGLRLIPGAEALELELGLRPGISSALYAETAGTVDPWQLCYAAYENAVSNGCRAYMNSELKGIRRDGAGYVMETARGELHCAAIINCAGLYADRVQEMLFPPSVRIFPNGADYLVLEKDTVGLRHIVLHEPGDGEKGLTAVPTTGGNVLLGPSERDSVGRSAATAAEGLAFVRGLAQKLLAEYDDMHIIRSFAATRPNPHRVVYRGGQYVPDGSSIGSFVIENPEPGFISFIGVKTPGLTCANELGALAAERMAAYLGAKTNPDFRPERKAMTRAGALGAEARRGLVQETPDYGRIVCRCEDISEGEILEAIDRGAVTVDGVKRRCGAMLGVCQGSRCQRRIVELLAQKLNIPVSAVTKSGGGSYITGGGHG